MQHKLHKIDALYRLKKRLPERHPTYEKVCLDLYNYTAEIGNVDQVDQELRKVNLVKPFTILSNLEILNPLVSGRQIDVLVATTKYFLILEVKNWTGSLNFKYSSRHVIETTSTSTESHECSCVKIGTIRDQMVHWFKSKNIDIPVYHAVISPNASTIINKSAIINNIQIASELLILLKEHEKLPQVLSNDLFQEIISTLQSQNTPFTLKPLCQQYSIHPTDLKRGLFCSDCHFHLLEKSSRIYYCPNCMNIPDNPFAEAMMDWFILVRPSITNKELKVFTNTSNSQIIGYFMKSSGFVKTGHTRDSVYHYS